MSHCGTEWSRWCQSGVRASDDVTKWKEKEKNNWKDRKIVTGSPLHHRLQSVIITVFIIHLAPTCHLHRLRSYGLLSTLINNLWCKFLKFSIWCHMSNGTISPTPYLCIIYIACTHPILCLICTHIYTWLVRQKQVMEPQDSTLKLKETNENFNLWQSWVQYH